MTKDLITVILFIATIRKGNSEQLSMFSNVFKLLYMAFIGGNDVDSVLNVLVLLVFSRLTSAG